MLYKKQIDYINVVSKFCIYFFSFVSEKNAYRFACSDLKVHQQISKTFYFPGMGNVIYCKDVHIGNTFRLYFFLLCLILSRSLNVILLLRERC